MDNIATLHTPCTAGAGAPPATKFRHPYETFTWLDRAWDIARFWRELDAGKIQPELQDLDSTFIEGYATGLLGLEKGMTEQRSLSPLMYVNVKEALGLPVEALDEPLVIVRARKGKGILRLCGHATADHVLADGNHRIARAFLDGRPSLK